MTKDFTPTAEADKSPSNLSTKTDRLVEERPEISGYKLGLLDMSAKLEELFFNKLSHYMHVYVQIIIVKHVKLLVHRQGGRDRQLRLNLTDQ